MVMMIMLNKILTYEFTDAMKRRFPITNSFIGSYQNSDARFKNALTDLCNNLSYDPPYRILISGPTGSGKTRLILTLSAVLGFNVSNSIDIVHKIETQSIFGIINSNTTSTMAYDDVGLEPKIANRDGMAEYEIMWHIINRRIQNNSSVVIATNLSSEQFKQRYGNVWGDTIIKRLKSYCKHILLKERQ